MLVPHWMGDESWRSPAFLQSLLVSLDSDISSRYKQFLVSVSAGGGAARNRRRKACGRDLVSCILRALAISAESALNSGDVGRRRDCISLSEIIQERLTEINADSFVWTKSVPLVPNVDFESVLATYCEAAGSAFEDLGQSQSGSSTDRPVVATPARPSASSSARSRSPASRDRDHSLRAVVPITPRPSIGGFPTPIPPSPRPVVSGQRTPTPPKAKAKPNSGHPRSPVLPPQQPVAEALDQPDEEGEVIAPAAPVTPPRLLPLSELHRYDSMQIGLRRGPRPGGRVRCRFRVKHMILRTRTCRVPFSTQIIGSQICRWLLLQHPEYCPFPETHIATCFLC